MKRIILKKLLVFLVLLILVSAVGSSVSAEEPCWKITQITDNDEGDYSVDIWEDQVVRTRGDVEKEK